MPLYRAYIDKEITDKGGGDHARVVDAEADSQSKFEKALKLKKGEVLNQIVSLHVPGEEQAAQASAITDAIADELALEMGIEPAEARRLAAAAVSKAKL